MVGIFGNFVIGRIFDHRGVRIGLVVVGVGAAAAGAAVVLTTRRAIRDRQQFEAARAEWAAMGSSEAMVVVLHQPPRPTTCLSLSPFNTKVCMFIYINMLNSTID